MRNFVIPLVPAFVALALAACSEKPAETPVDSGSSGSLANSSPATAASSLPSAIPAAMQGRWGLVPADCTSTRGDAKGLLTIGPADLRFYESVGRLQTVGEGGADTLRATFAFTGEGMEWQRDMALNVQDGGKVLVRREFGAEAASGAFHYQRCE